MKRKKFERHLRAHNCQLLKHGAKHDKYINLSNNRRTTVPRHTELKYFLCVEICKQLEIPIIKKG